MKFYKCERAAAAVPKECQLMGFAMADFASLAAEGAYQLTEKKMDEKMMGVVRHILTAVGALFVYAGYTDDATWVMVSGSMATMIGFAWSWMSKA
jgi:hypothetical protein